jgi:CHAT domain-containing protein
LADAALQASFFDQALPLYEDMVRVQLERHDPDRALSYLERGRARQLIDSLARPEPGSLGTRPEALPLPSDAASMSRMIPNGVVLVYYLSLEDRLLSWTLTRGGARFADLPVSSSELRRLVSAHRASLERTADPLIVLEASAQLYDAVLRSLLVSVDPNATLVFVPDAVLQPVAFAALWDRRAGRYLVEDHVVGLSPSGTVFVMGSRPLSPLRSRDGAVLVVGNPRVDPRRWPGISPLPDAEREAIEIAGLYPAPTLLTGKEATKAAFLTRASGSRIIHIAGHAAGGDSPLSAHLLFAPDPVTNDTGALYGYELEGRSLRETEVVVLAACRTAGGAISSSEGALSLARPWLAFGVPSVVASQWEIDDFVSRRFFVAFHRAFQKFGEPLLALRDAQLRLMRSGNSDLAHPSNWAAFVCLGGRAGQRPPESVPSSLKTTAP